MQYFIAMMFVCESLNVAITGLHPLAGLANSES